jgi:purine-nucleoside phosphorylase
MIPSTPPTTRILESVEYVRSVLQKKPRTAVVLGSGLGDFADSLRETESVETARIPHYPRSTVEGHKGKLVFGSSGAHSIMAFQGRVHYYESGDLETVLYPIRVARLLGISTLIITNAAGGINRSFKPGDLMLITDQINLTLAQSPAISPRPAIKSANVYDPELITMAMEEARRRRLPLKQGVYCGVKGPSYETASEVEMIRRIGGDAVGMSTVNESSLAVSLGMRIVGVSCITNLATGILNVKLSHSEVTEVADRVKSTFSSFITGLVSLIDSQSS